MNKGKITMLVLVGLLVLLAFNGMSSYNSMTQSSENVDGQWGNVETQYQRRFDLIPNLVSTVKAYANVEKETLIAVTEARAAALGAMKKAGETGDIAEFDNSTMVLSGAMRGLFGYTEKYPDLKSSQGFRDLQVQLEGTENRISKARTDYNESVKSYNKKVKMFLQIEVEVTNAPCNGDDGSIEVEIVNAYPAVDVVFNIEGAEYILDNLYGATAGSYIVNAALDIDIFGCATSVDVEIYEPDLLVIEASATDASVLGNGIGTEFVTGGTPDYTIVWMYADDNTPADQNALPEGNYLVRVTDANYCEAETTVSVIWNNVVDINPVNFNIYPNPTNGYVTITSSVFLNNSTIKIIDGVGRVVINTDAPNLSNGLSLDFNHLDGGIYSVVIDTENGLVVQQIQLVK